MSGIGKPSYEEVKQWVMLDPGGNGIMSMSILQRRFRIGYVNAATLMERLEEEGIVSPWDGSKPRTIIKQE
ncbi:DNA translocase FtsK [Bacillus velezensis]|uniref:DNA translocase FtsK n=1 Tax=Bacillus velezensis TaxID=492670 RepID=UPI0022E4D019|nr:DNA translocase FtsK [Bacillus velezensis]